MSVTAPHLWLSPRALLVALVLLAAAPVHAIAAPPDEHLRIPIGDGWIAATVVRGEGEGPRPVVVMGSGLGGLFSDVPTRYARLFAARGMTVLGFDYRHFGESSGEPRRLGDMRAQREDWRAAIAAVPTLGDVDASRVALWGTSMGGGHALGLASEYPSLRAVVAQVPHLGAGAAQTPMARMLELGRLVMRDIARAAMRRAPVEVPFVGRPGTVALMTEAGAFEHYDWLAGQGLPRVNRTPARTALSVATYSPLAAARRSQVPTFIVAAARDRVAPAWVARGLARQLDAQYREVDTGHFGVYRGSAFDELAPLEAAFLAARLDVG